MTEPRISPTTNEKILWAMAHFNQYLRKHYRWAGNKYGIVGADGQSYPPKLIISLATGLSVRMFSGGAESHRYLTKLGFSIRDIRTGKIVARPPTSTTKAA